MRGVIASATRSTLDVTAGRVPITDRTPAMPRPQRRRTAQHDLDDRAARYPGHVQEPIELAYLRAGAEPDWERPHRDGVDVTDHPELWSPYQALRRRQFDARVAAYRRDGLI